MDTSSSGERCRGRRRGVLWSAGGGEASSLTTDALSASWVPVGLLRHQTDVAAKEATTTTPSQSNLVFARADIELTLSLSTRTRKC